MQTTASTFTIPACFFAFDDQIGGSVLGKITSAKEYKLLLFLLCHPRHVLSRDQILEHVWEGKFEGLSNNVNAINSLLVYDHGTVGRPLSPRKIPRLVGDGMYRLNT